VTNPIILGALLMGPMLLGFLLYLALADRYWGTSILGGFVKARSKLIYEGRPWWWEHVMLYITGAFTITAISLWPLILFSSSQPPSLFYQTLVVLWGTTILASIIVGWYDRREQIP